MKKLLVIFLCIASVFLLSACGNNETEQTREDVIINLPKDNSVNGYRTEKTETSDNTFISADKVGIDNSTGKNNTNKTENSNSKGAFCGNKNSGVFHEINCGSVSKMKDTNKAYFSNRNEAVQSGYKPCGICKP